MRRSSPYDREILRLAVPAFGALVAEPLYLLADTAVVGHLGTDELAGLAVAAAILLSGYSIFIFLAYGTTAAVARLIGAGNQREAAHQGIQSLWLAVAIGVVVTGAGLLLAGPLVSLFGGRGAVAANALVYLRISLLGGPALLVVLAGTGYLRGRQDTRTPLVVAVVSAGFNLALELVLIYGLGFGIGASALSTVLAQVGAAAVYATGVVRAVRTFGISLRPHVASIGRLAAVGVDLLVRTMALRVTISLSTAVAARIGTAAVAAHEVAFAIWSLLALGLDAIAIAGQAMTGRRLGADRPDDARAAANRMIELGVGLGAGFGLLVVLLRPVVPELFTDDPAVVALTGFLLWFVAAMQPVNAVVFVLDGVLIGAGDMRFLARAMAAATAVFVVGAAAVLVLDLGVGWLWAAIGAWMFARLVALSARYVGGRWMVTGAPAA
ncbi:MAG: MATE family efflux transporter [Acidimicrobiales bacterium]